MNYPIYNKEILVIIQAFEHWRLKLTGTNYLVKVFTDYKVLKYFINIKVLLVK